MLVEVFFALKRRKLGPALTKLANQWLILCVDCLWLPLSLFDLEGKKLSGLSINNSTIQMSVVLSDRLRGLSGLALHGFLERDREQ